MSFANRYNKGNRFDIDTTGFKYVKLSALDPEQTYELKGLYINTKGEYGASPVAILSDCFVNLPAHLLPVVNDMLLSDETIADIKAGKCGFTPREYTDKKGASRVSVEWVDL